MTAADRLFCSSHFSYYQKSHKGYGEPVLLFSYLIDSESGAHQLLDHLVLPAFDDPSGYETAAILKYAAEVILVHDDHVRYDLG